MRKPAFLHTRKKAADQLYGHRAADQLLRLPNIVKSLYFLNLKFKASSYFLWFMSDLVESPKDRFSHYVVHKV